jgi:hypothetical protein
MPQKELGMRILVGAACLKIGSNGGVKRLFGVLKGEEYLHHLSTV